MDVFRTGRRGRVVPLTEENYRRETNRKAPFVQMRGGHPSYFAVCPACGNPILICNPVGQSVRPALLGVGSWSRGL